MSLSACACGRIKPCPVHAKPRGDPLHAKRVFASGRSTNNWRKRRERVKRRDGLRCQDCGRERGELEAHERLEVHLDPALRGNHRIAQDEDCQTLCSTCHAKVGFLEGNPRIPSLVRGEKNRS